MRSERQMLGREATTLRTGLDCFAVRRAVETAESLAGTVEFFLKGRYHFDGRHKCGVPLRASMRMLAVATARNGNAAHCMRVAAAKPADRPRRRRALGAACRAFPPRQRSPRCQHGHALDPDDGAVSSCRYAHS